MRALLRSLLAIPALLIVSGAAQAQVSYTLSPPPNPVTTGDTFTISGTLTNTGATPLFFNGADEHIAPDPTLDTAGFQFNDNNFLLNIIPTIPSTGLAPGASVSGDLFDVTVTTIFRGNYTALFTVLGGPDTFTTDPLVPDPNANPAETFGTSFVITVVPEPTAAPLLLSAMVTGGLWLKRRKR